MSGAVFITDGNQRSTLAAVRALGGAAVPVTVGEMNRPSLAGSSRYCHAQLGYPSPSSAGQAFQDFMAAEMQTGKYRVLLPMTDVTNRLLAEARPRLEPHVALPIASVQALARVQDKREMLLAAQHVGISCPRTYMLGDDDLQAVARQAHYPVVIKPRFSRFLRDGAWVSGGVQYAHSPQDLIVKYQQAHAQIPCPMVQEKIEGDGSGIFLLVWNGQLKGAFCHRRLREKPPWGGVSVLRESIPLNDDLMRKSFALLQAVGWNGVAMVEFKIDRRDGEAKLMEVNGRFWGSLQLAIDAGVNFPLMLYRLALGEDVPARFDYLSGVKSRWLLGDLDHLFIRLRYPQACNGVAGSRFTACLDFLKFYQRNTRYEVFRLDDPAPGWWELKQYFRETLGSKEASGAR